MRHVAHELYAELPQQADQLHHLRMTDAHFQRIAERYHHVNREIHRIEAEVEAASDFRLEDLKKQRLAMLDEVVEMISKAETVLLTQTIPLPGCALKLHQGGSEWFCALIRRLSHCSYW